jgi:hypothetical protein
MTAAPAEPFRYLGLDLDPGAGRVRATYRLGGRTFTEEAVVGPGPGWGSPAAAEAARWFALLAGTSYYKTAAPPRIDLGPLATTPAERDFLTLVYRQGLAEFAHRNGLDLSGLVLEGPDAAGPPGAATPGPARPAPARPLVPFGGGLDSAVVAEEVRAHGADLSLFVVGRPDHPYAALEAPLAASGLPVVRATRAVDPAVLAGDPSFRTGHVPVTGILSALALLAAAVHGHDAVVMANEWSASRPTVLADGQAVNHQWSKSLAFEAGLRAVLAGGPAAGLDYFSYLRPRSELWVARRFAEDGRYRTSFRSCNRAFAADPARRLDTWCGECDKCCFIDLVLAPFLSPEALAEVFGGREPLRRPDLLGRFEALVGLGGTKPFECVGDEEESGAAARLAAARPDRAGDPVLAALVPRLGPAPERDWFGVLGPHFLPDAWAPQPQLA